MVRTEKNNMIPITIRNRWVVLLSVTSFEKNGKVLFMHYYWVKSIGLVVI